MLLDCYKSTFARKFTAASSHYLECTTTPVTTYPCTIGCWFQAADLAANYALMSIGTTGGSPRMVLFALSTGFVASANEINNQPASTSYSANKWTHACAVFESSTSRSIYSNGAGKATDTSLVSISGLNTINIGARWSTTRGSFHNGLIAWPAIWNAALGDADIAALASGAHPATVKPASLAAFWDFDGREKEFGMKAAYPLTNSGSLPINGPVFLRTRIPRPWMLGAGYVAPAGGNRRRRTIICGAAA